MGRAQAYLAQYHDIGVGSEVASASPHRLVSLLTAEAVVDLDIKVGDEAVAVVKATNVIVEIPSKKETRS